MFIVCVWKYSNESQNTQPENSDKLVFRRVHVSVLDFVNIRTSDVPHNIVYFDSKARLWMIMMHWDERDKLYISTKLHTSGRNYLVVSELLVSKRSALDVVSVYYMIMKTSKEK